MGHPVYQTHEEQDDGISEINKEGSTKGTH